MIDGRMMGHNVKYGGVERGAVLCIKGVRCLGQGGMQVQKEIAVTNAGDPKIIRVKHLGRQITKKSGKSSSRFTHVRYLLEDTHIIA